jgi:hypothetical protein
MKVGDIIKHIEVNIPSKTNFIYDRVSFEVKEYKILGISDLYVCLDNKFFNTLSLKGSAGSPMFELPVVDINSMGISYSLYTAADDIPSIEDIKKYLQVYIEFKNGSLKELVDAL